MRRFGLRLLLLIVITGLPAAPLSTSVCEITDFASSPCGGAGLNLGAANPCVAGNNGCLDNKWS